LLLFQKAGRPFLDNSRDKDHNFFNRFIDLYFSAPLTPFYLRNPYISASNKESRLHLRVLSPKPSFSASSPADISLISRSCRIFREFTSKKVSTSLREPSERNKISKFFLNNPLQYIKTSIHTQLLAYDVRESDLNVIPLNK